MTIVETKPRSWLATTLFFSTIGSVCLVAIAFFQYGSLRVALNRLRGVPLIPDNYLMSAGRLEPGSERIVEFRLTNYSPGPIRLFGARCSCTCVVADDLPKTIARGQTIPFKVTAKARTKNRRGPFVETVQLFTDSEWRNVLVLQVSGEIVPTTTSVAGSEGRP